MWLDRNSHYCPRSCKSRGTSLPVPKVIDQVGVKIEVKSNVSKFARLQCSVATACWMLPAGVLVVAEA